MAENPENTEDKPDLFSPSGEALGYISLEQARVLAIRHARDNMDFYGPRYSGINLVWEVISQEDGEEYYDIRVSFRPAGRFRGEPGVEQFVIDKLGNIEYRQMLDEPTGLDLPDLSTAAPQAAFAEPTASVPSALLPGLQLFAESVVSTECLMSILWPSRADDQEFELCRESLQPEQ